MVVVSVGRAATLHGYYLKVYLVSVIECCRCCNRFVEVYKYRVTSWDRAPEMMQLGAERFSRAILPVQLYYLPVYYLCSYHYLCTSILANIKR